MFIKRKVLAAESRALARRAERAALIDRLRARVDAQLALYLSSVELARAAGLPLVERTP